MGSSTDALTHTSNNSVHTGPGCTQGVHSTPTSPAEDQVSQTPQGAGQGQGHPELISQHNSLVAGLGLHNGGGVGGHALGSVAAGAQHQQQAPAQQQLQQHRDPHKLLLRSISEPAHDLATAHFLHGHGLHHHPSAGPLLPHNTFGQQHNNNAGSHQLFGGVGGLSSSSFTNPFGNMWYGGDLFAGLSSVSSGLSLPLSTIPDLGRPHHGSGGVTDLLSGHASSQHHAHMLSTTSAAAHALASSNHEAAMAEQFASSVLGGDSRRQSASSSPSPANAVLAAPSTPTLGNTGSGGGGDAAGVGSSSSPATHTAGRVLSQQQQLLGGEGSTLGTQPPAQAGQSHAHTSAVSAPVPMSSPTAQEEDPHQAGSPRTSARNYSRDLVDNLCRSLTDILPPMPDADAGPMDSPPQPHHHHHHHPLASPLPWALTATPTISAASMGGRLSVPGTPASAALSPGLLGGSPFVFPPVGAAAAAPSPVLSAAHPHQQPTTPAAPPTTPSLSHSTTGAQAAQQHHHEEGPVCTCLHGPPTSGLIHPTVLQAILRRKTTPGPLYLSALPQQSTDSGSGKDQNGVSGGSSRTYPPNKKEGNVCANCKVADTCLWRQVDDNVVLCNACGLYYVCGPACTPFGSVLVYVACLYAFSAATSCRAGLSAFLGVFLHTLGLPRV